MELYTADITTELEPNIILQRTQTEPFFPVFNSNIQTGSNTQCLLIFERIRGEVLTTMRYTNRCLPLPYISKDSIIIIHKYKTLWLLSLSRTIMMLHGFYIQITKTLINI